MIKNEKNNTKISFTIEDVNLLFEDKKTDKQIEKIFEFINYCIKQKEFIFPDKSNLTEEIKQKIKALEQISEELKKRFFETKQEQTLDLNLDIFNKIQDQLKN